MSALVKHTLLLGHDMASGFVLQSLLQRTLAQH